MKRIDWKTLALCMLGTALVVTLLNRSPEAVASRGGDTDRGDELIAVTGEYGSNAAVLYLIDPKTRHMAVYKCMNGSTLELVAARRVEHDLKLMSWNDATPGSMSPEKLAKKYNEYIGGVTKPSHEGGESGFGVGMDSDPAGSAGGPGGEKK